MKPQVRVMGIDDAPFSFEDQRVEVVGAMVRVPSYLEGILLSDVQVDGEDATERVCDMISRSRFKEGLALIMVDGVAFGGFNVVDIEAMYESLSIPVATVTKKQPDIQSMERALRARFSDWRERLEIIKRSTLHRVRTPHKPLYVHAVGMVMQDVKELIGRSTVRGALPEPLRIAHLIATAIKVGESKGSS